MLRSDTLSSLLGDLRQLMRQRERRLRHYEEGLSADIRLEADVVRKLEQQVGCWEEIWNEFKALVELLTSTCLPSSGKRKVKAFMSLLPLSLKIKISENDYSSFS
jgi:hypothetical protein